MKRWYILLIVFCLLVTGCAAKAPDNPDPLFPMPEDGEEADYTDSDGTHVIIRTGEYLDIPEELPDEARILPDLINLYYYMIQDNPEEGSRVFTLCWASEESTEAVSQFFEDSMSGMDRYDFQRTDEGSMITGATADYEITIMVQTDGVSSRFTMIVSNVPAVG